MVPFRRLLLSDIAVDHYAYGVGKRLCPGIHLAEHIQWHITARLLWAFDISPVSNLETGEPVQLDLDAYADGLIQQPLPYEVYFKPRSNLHKETFMRVAEEAGVFLKQFEEL